MAENHLATLSNGNKMPRVGLGTWQAKPEEVDAAVTTALDVGYRLVDTAAVYENEVAIGNTLERYFQSGKLKRADIFIVTKLWVTHNRPEDVESALRESLRKLKTDYVDLYLVHQPVSYDHKMEELDNSQRVEITWRSMEAIYEKGLAKAIGVSNFNEEQIERIMKNAKVPIHNSQVELHLLFQQEKHVACCRKHNILVTAYAPIGSPGRSQAKSPSAKPMEWFDAQEPLKNKEVLKIAERYNKTPAQILLRHLVQKDILVIPKSKNPERVEENLKIFDFKLTDDEMQNLNGVKQGPRLFLQSFSIGSVEDPWKDERPSKH